ncbi:MAG: heavy metal translocating P-type ATPase metal-binding domain-containing protein [Sulfuritalea sp.]|jgi:hypothetical protein|nr:heavy metal translocating P-type ATPase metal-binding domain-containing protein [Sulfuritalea sp.]
MNDADRPCDLCSLPVGVKPFTLALPGKTLEFCCEGCRGIYEILHEIKESPDQPGQHDKTV